MPAVGPRRILIVDVSAPAIKHARVALEYEGFEVMEARDSEEALALLSRHSFLLVVAAIGLPGRSGYDLCRDLRGASHTASLPVLLTFSPMDLFDSGRAQRAGAAGVLAKPFLPSHLIEKVGEVLGEEILGARTSGERRRSDFRSSGERLESAEPSPPEALPPPPAGSTDRARMREASQAPDLPAGFVEPLGEEGEMENGADLLLSPLRDPSGGVDATQEKQIQALIDRRIEALLAPGGALRAAIDMALERMVRERVETRFPKILEQVARERAGQGGNS